MSPAEQARLDNAEAASVKNADIIEYIAMMADVEIPEDSEGSEENIE